MGYYSGIGTKRAVSGNASVLLKGVTVSGGDYGYTGKPNAKATYDSSYGSIKSNVLTKYVVGDISNQYIVLFTSSERTMEVYMICVD